MNPAQSSSKARHADLALAAFLAPIVAGRRVAVVGARSGEVALRARSLGAATVVSFGGVGEDLAVRALVPGALASFHGRLDVVVVPNGAEVPSLVAVLDEARRALGSEGVLVVASEPDDAPRALEQSGKGGVSYDALRSLCAERFGGVQLFGRGPFVGYLLASLDEGAESVSLETRLIDGDPARPEAFVAVASDSAVELDLLALVQVPETLLEDVASRGQKGAEEELSKTREKLKEVETASAERWVKLQRFEHGIKELEDDNRKQRERAVKLSKELEDERKLRQRVELETQMTRKAPELPKGVDPEIEKLRGEVAQREKAIQAAQDAAAANEHQRESALAEATRARKERDEARRERDALRSERDSLRSEREALKVERDALASSRGALEGERDSLRSERDQLATKGAESAISAGALTALEGERAELQKKLASAEAEAESLRRELDETQSSEAELQAQVEKLSAAPKGNPRREKELRDAVTKAEARAKALVDEHQAALSAASDEHAKLESLLKARAAEIIDLKAAVARGGELVKELSWSLSQAQSAMTVAAPTVDAGWVETLEAQRDESMAALVTARAETARWQTEALQHASEAQAAKWLSETLQATVTTLEQSLATRAVALPSVPVETASDEVSEGPDDTAALASLQREVESLEVREARLSGALRGMSARVRECEQLAQELDRQLTIERSAHEQQRIATHEARGEVARLYAVNLGIEARMAHRSMELDGARAGYERRVAELQQEVERLLRALEVAGTQAASEIGEQLDARERTLEGVRAEAQGAALRLREAELAITQTAAATRTRVEGLKAEVEGLRHRLREAEGAVTALQALRASEPELLDGPIPDEAEPAVAGPGGFKLDEVMGDLNATALRLAETEEALASTKAEALRTGELVSRLSSEADARDVQFRAVVAQLDDRDRHVSALERRVRDEVDALAAQNRELTEAVSKVREGISAILVDGRGALVAHDLVGILRSVEGIG